MYQGYLFSLALFRSCVCARPHTRVNICNPNLENLQSALLWLATLSTQIKLPCKTEWYGIGWDGMWGVGCGMWDAPPAVVYVFKYALSLSISNEWLVGNFCLAARLQLADTRIRRYFGRDRQSLPNMYERVCA